MQLISKTDIYNARLDLFYPIDIVSTDFVICFEQIDFSFLGKRLVWRQSGVSLLVR